MPSARAGPAGRPICQPHESREYIALAVLLLVISVAMIGDAVENLFKARMSIRPRVARDSTTIRRREIPRSLSY